MSFMDYYEARERDRWYYTDEVSEQIDADDEYLNRKVDEDAELDQDAEGERPTADQARGGQRGVAEVQTQPEGDDD